VTAPVRDPSPRPIHDRAIQDLSFIRRAMEGASAFTDVPGWGTVVVGVTAVGATLVARAQPTAGRWLLTWLIEAVLAASIAGLFIWRKASGRVAAARVGAQGAESEDRPVFGIAARKFLFGFWPGIVAGALLTFALVDFPTVWTAQGIVPRVLPGLWLLLYGVAILTAGAYSVRAVPFMGLGFMLLGAIALFIPTIPADLMLALGFGALHIVSGIVIARRHGG
jgi:hypothetical protein